MSKNKLPDLAKKASVKRQLTVNLATTLHVLTKQGSKLKKSSRSPFGDQLEKCSRQMQIFSRQFL